MLPDQVINNAPWYIAFIVATIWAVGKWLAPWVGAMLQSEIEKSTQHQAIVHEKREVELSAERQRLSAELEANKLMVDMIQRNFTWLQEQMQEAIRINAVQSEVHAKTLSEIQMVNQATRDMMNDLARQRMAISALIESMPSLRDMLGIVQSMDEQIVQNKRDTNELWGRMRDVSRVLHQHGHDVSPTTAQRESRPSVVRDVQRNVPGVPGDDDSHLHAVVAILQEDALLPDPSP